MDDSTARVVASRQALHDCFTRARDALFDLCDALATDPGARSSSPPCPPLAVAVLCLRVA